MEDNSANGRADRIRQQIQALRERAATAAFGEVRLAYLEMALVLARAADTIERGTARATGD